MVQDLETFYDHTPLFFPLYVLLNIRGQVYERKGIALRVQCSIKIAMDFNFKSNNNKTGT